MAQFEYTNHLASGMRSAACASIFQINFSSISMTRRTNTCFSKPLRAYSHGCMRVEYPDKYAENVLLSPNPRKDIPLSALL